MKTSEKFYPMAFKSRFSFNTDGQFEFQKPVFGNPICRVMALGEAGKVTEDDRSDIRGRSSFESHRGRGGSLPYTDTKCGPEAPATCSYVIRLPLKHTVPICFSKMYCSLFFYCINRQWASQRLEWWQLLALCCQGKYLAACRVSWEQVSTWPQSFPSLS